MRSEVKFFATFVFMLTFSIFIQSAAYAIPTMSITFSQNPTTSAPGSDGYIQVVMTNPTSSVISNIQITASAVDEGINLSTPTNVNIGGLAPNSATSALFKFSVPQNTQTGLYRVSFSINYCDTSSICVSTNEYAIVNVQSQSQLIVSSISPAELGIGSNTTVDFTFQNTGSSNLNSVVVSWSEPTNSILPLGMSNKISLGSIPAASQVVVPVQVVVSPSAAPNAYSLIFNIQFYDQSGTFQNISQNVGILVGGTTKFSASVQDFTNGVVTLSVANIGVNPATSVLVSIPQQKGFSVVGSQSEFLGNLNPGDSTIATFNLVQFNKNTTEPTNLLVEISYTDTSGARQTVEQNVTLSATTGLFGSSASASGAAFQRRNSYSLLYYIIGIIIVVAIAYYIWRRRRKQR